MSFISGIAGGLLSANAQGNAASALEKGAQQAQSTLQTNQTAANAAQQTALTNVTGAEQPYQTLGSTAANGLNSLLGQGFQAPTLQQAENTPGYQFQLQQGTQALDENAAANGTLMSGNTGKALEQYGQNLAQGAYQQTYNNALQAYQANASTLQAGANLGLSSTGQLGQANLTTAGNTANIDLTSAQQIANQQNNAAKAAAGGILGQAAGYSSAIAGAAGAAGNFATGGVSGLLGGSGGWNPSTGFQ